MKIGATVEVLGAREILKTKVFTFIEEELQFEGHSPHKHFTVKHPGAATFLPLREDGKVLLVEQYRHSVKAAIFECPAGTLEPGEDPKECAKREVVEETGYSASRWTSLGELVLAPGFTDERQYLFLAEDLTEKEQKLDENEVLEVRPFTVSEMEEAIKSGKIIDAKTITLFCRARLMGLL